ncbi:hypothetical protein ACW9HC_28430 [Nocardia gipuzkoensis]
MLIEALAQAYPVEVPTPAGGNLRGDLLRAYEMTGAPVNSIHVDWAEITGVSRTTLTTRLWTAPPLRRSSPIHDKAFDARRALDADLVRFLPWYSHPRIAVAELNPPTASETFWSFELLDPLVEDFMAATGGRPVVANFATELRGGTTGLRLPGR